MRKLYSLLRAVGTLLLAGVVAASPAKAADIVIGQVTPLSGLDANQGRAYSAGMQIHFDNVNKAGGIHGHRLSLVVRDDGGKPDETVAATRKLLAEVRPLALAGYFGGRNIAELAKSGLLSAEKVPLIGYRISEIAPDLPQLYNVRAGLKEELQKIAQHLGTIGITNLALLYEEGPAGAEVVAAMEEAVAHNKGKLVAKAGYPVGSSRVSPAVERFLAAAPQAIVLVASGAAAAGFIEQYRTSNGGAMLFAHSGADVEQLSKRLTEEQLQGVAIAQVTPSPYRISSRIAKELADLLVGNPELERRVSFAMMEGYITAKVITEALRRGGPRVPSRESFTAALDGLNNVDLGGHAVSYRGGNRTGSRFVELSIVSSSGRIRQ